MNQMLSVHQHSVLSTMTCGCYFILLAISFLLPFSTHVSLALPTTRRRQSVMSNLAEQYRNHFNVSAGDLPRTFRSRQNEAHVLMRQLLERYEVTHIATGKTVYFCGFTAEGADGIKCPEHDKTIADEYAETGTPLKFPALPCVVYQEVSCVVFEKARKTFYLPLENLKLTRKYYADDDDALRACEKLTQTSTTPIDVKDLIARKGAATVTTAFPIEDFTKIS